MSQKTIEQIQAELDEAIPRSAVSLREGGRGVQLSYLTGHYVIARLNKIFGNLNWASEVRSLEKLYEGKISNSRGQEQYYVSYGATVRLVVQGPNGVATEHVEVGFGDGQDANNPGKPHELARKEAVTDALKRCAKNLGMSMGLALYDKDQPNVAEDEESKTASKEETKPVAKVATKSAVKAAAPAQDKETLMKIITSASTVVLKQGTATREGLIKVLDERYQAKKKEDLNEEQAKDFLGFLNNLSPGVAPMYSNGGVKQ